MSPTRTVTLTNELYDQASREAAAEGKTTDDITRDALTAHLALRRLERLREYGQQRADELGVTRAFQLGITRRVDVAISNPIRAEVLRTLRDKFRWSEERLTEASALIGSAATTVVPTVTLHAVERDPDDDHPRGRVPESHRGSGHRGIGSLLGPLEAPPTRTD